MTSEFRIGRTLVGAILLLAALVGALVYAIVPILMGMAQGLTMATLGFAVAILGGLLGGLLVWGGTSRAAWLKERVGGAVLWPSIAILAAGLLGGVIALRTPWRAYLFPPFHLLTFLGWAGILFRFFSLDLPKLERGDIVLEAAYGAFIATSLGGILELVLFALVGGLAFGLSAALPMGQDWMRTLEQLLSQPESLADMGRLLDVLRLPPVAFTLGVSLVLLAPLVEETLKPLGVLWADRSAATRGHFILRGALCGLGFGLMESLANAAMAGSGWALTTAIRATTMGMHGLTGALMGAGWFYLLKERKIARGLGLYLFSLVLHGMWNGVAFAGIYAAFRASNVLPGFSS